MLSRIGNRAVFARFPLGIAFTELITGEFRRDRTFKEGYSAAFSKLTKQHKPSLELG